MNVIRQFLKDNGITCTPDNETMNDLLDGIPDIPENPKLYAVG